jgi:putative DNA primase/helicase
LEAAEPFVPERAEVDAGEAAGESGGDDGDDWERPSELGEGAVDSTIVAECARLDHSDTDNGQRFRAHFGRDLAVLAQADVAGGDLFAWTGTHWDRDDGLALSHTWAQRVGGLIALEADHLAATPHEKRAIEAAEDAGNTIGPLEARRADLGDAERARLRELERAIEAGKTARSALDKRKASRRKFGVSSKNKSRIESMIACALPHLRRPADSFNADPLKVATLTHTLRFVTEADPDCPDPDVERKVARLVVEDGHRREDALTGVVPVAFDTARMGPDARPGKWRKFVERMLPSAEKRRTVQQFAGLGLTGMPIQRIMFHYGLGANGKSVFLETLSRALGESIAVGLPVESIVGGGERSAGGASPDIARMLGKRFLRVLELPKGMPLREDVVKRLTGGEKIPVRTLFKGFFEFVPIAKAHMSGNGFPTIDGTDNGIWRRIFVVHWTETIPEAEQRDIGTVVGELIDEDGPGILAWLVEGVLDYLENGFVVAEEIRAATQAYRESMDPIGEFVRDCVEPWPEGTVQARLMYQAYESWSKANAKRVRSETKFGTVMEQYFPKDRGRTRSYLGCRLHDVPERPDERPPPASPDDYGRYGAPREPHD